MGGGVCLLSSGMFLLKALTLPTDRPSFQTHANKRLRKDLSPLKAPVRDARASRTGGRHYSSFTAFTISSSRPIANPSFSLISIIPRFSGSM